MRQYHVPGVAIAVVDARGPVSSAAYGYADESESTPVGNATVFEGASLGKPLFAYAVLRREGVPRFDPDRGRGSPGSAVRVGFRGRDRHRTPSLEPHVRPRVFRGPRQKISWHSSPACSGSTQWRSASAASSLHTSADDYGCFVGAVLAGALENGDGVAARMLEPQVQVNDALSLSWGPGWAVASDGTDEIFLHWGSNPGYKSLALGSLEQETGMVILTNGDNGLEVATRLVPVVLGRNYPFLEFFMLHPDD